jgi:hypothetical protein
MTTREPKHVFPKAIGMIVEIIVWFFMWLAGTAVVEFLTGSLQGRF